MTANGPEMDVTPHNELERKVLSGDTTAIRRYATEIRAYRKSGDPHVVAILLKALDNAQGLGSRTIIYYLPVVPEIEPVLIRVLNSGYDYVDPLDGPIHVDAVAKLAALGTPTALAAIHKWMVGFPRLDETNRLYVCKGLGALRNERNYWPFIRSFLTHHDAVMRSAAVGVVGTMQDREAVPDLIRLLSDNTTSPLSSYL